MEKYFIVMLPICKSHKRIGQIWANKTQAIIYDGTNIDESLNLWSKELYVFSKEEPTETDWKIGVLLPEETAKEYDYMWLDEECTVKRWKKLIATTQRKSIGGNKRLPPNMSRLYFINAGFVKAYVEEYNKGYIINEVYIKYTEDKMEMSYKRKMNLK